jgi:hypothetical protein
VLPGCGLRLLNNLASIDIHSDLQVVLGKMKHRERQMQRQSGAQSILNKPIEKYTESHRLISIEFKAYGFKKSGAEMRKKFKETTCIFKFSRLIGHEDENEILWQMLGAVIYDAFNPIFRPGRSIESLRIHDEDSGLTEGRHGLSSEPGNPTRHWRVNLSTKVEEQAHEFMEIYRPALDELEDCMTLEHISKGVRFHLENGAKLGMRSFIHGLMAARKLNGEEDFEYIMSFARNHSEINSVWAKKYLAMM